MRFKFSFPYASIYFHLPKSKVVCVSAYFCSGHKNTLRLQCRSSFKMCNISYFSFPSLTLLYFNYLCYSLWNFLMVTVVKICVFNMCFVDKYWIEAVKWIDIAQKMKFSIKDFFGKCDKIRSFLAMNYWEWHICLSLFG